MEYRNQGPTHVRKSKGNMGNFPKIGPQKLLNKHPPTPSPITFNLFNTNLKYGLTLLCLFHVSNLFMVCKFILCKFNHISGMVGFRLTIVFYIFS